MIVRKSPPEEPRRINERFAVCFEAPHSNCPIDPDNDGCTHWVDPDEEAEAEYLWNGHSFVSYESSEALRRKCKFLKENRLRGLMYWSRP